MCRCVEWDSGGGRGGGGNRREGREKVRRKKRKGGDRVVRKKECMVIMFGVVWNRNMLTSHATAKQCLQLAGPSTSLPWYQWNERLLVISSAYPTHVLNALRTLWGPIRLLRERQTTSVWQLKISYVALQQVKVLLSVPEGRGESWKNTKSNDVVYNLLWCHSDVIMLQ